MTVYADQTFYTQEYLQGRSAKVPAADFPFYARNASAAINSYAGAFPDDNIPEEVRLCCCEIAELLCTGDTSEASKKAGIASESVQGWSQSKAARAAGLRRILPSTRRCTSGWMGSAA